MCLAVLLLFLAGCLGGDSPTRNSPGEEGVTRDVTELGNFSEDRWGWRGGRSVNVSLTDLGWGNLSGLERTRSPGFLRANSSRAEGVVWNEERAGRAAFTRNPYLLVGVVPDVVRSNGSMLDTELEFSVRLHYPGGVAETESIVVRPVLPSTLSWNLSRLPGEALGNAERLEVVWRATEAVRGNASSEVVFTGIQLTSDFTRHEEARYGLHYRRLEFRHGVYEETEVTNSSEGYEEGYFVYSDGARVPYSYRYLGDGREIQTLNGSRYRLGDGWNTS